MIKGQILKILKGNIVAYDGAEYYSCHLPGKFKTDNQLKVGDWVDLTKNQFEIDSYVINKIYKRKNSLVRPSIANLESLLIVISPLPKPDLNLVDALIVYCLQNKILPILVINKSDTTTPEFIEEIKFQYKDVVKDIMLVSATTGSGVDKLKDKLTGKLSAFAGQSAVGKSSLINALTPHLDLKVQELSQKINRGKHTTRTTEIFVLDNMKLADTPGFSSLDLKVKWQDLKYYYNDFVKYSEDCKYTSCSHINAKPTDCGVINAVEQGNLSRDRYDRYIRFINKRRAEEW